MKVISLYFTTVGLLLLDIKECLLLLEKMLTNLENISHNQEQIIKKFLSIEPIVDKTKFHCVDEAEETRFIKPC